MPRSAPVDGFRLAYDRQGAGRPAVLSHGWPGDRVDEFFAAVTVRDVRGAGDFVPLEAPEAFADAVAAAL